MLFGHIQKDAEAVVPLAMLSPTLKHRLSLPFLKRPDIRSQGEVRDF